MYTALALVGISVLVQIVKKWIWPKFGETGIHIFTFLVAGIGTWIYMKYQHDVHWKEIIESGLIYMAATIALYEVLLKKLYTAMGVQR